MYIWLITIGEPLPTDGFGDRLMRAGILANMLVEKGHKVVWWTSTFDHVRKRQRYNKETVLEINDRYKIVMLHSIPYKKNVSFLRIFNHYGLARKFKRFSWGQASPDIVLCSLPPLELSLAAAEYGKKKGVPVILDIRDLWPEIFLELVPLWGKTVARWCLDPMFRTLRIACRDATSITGTTKEFVHWGVAQAGRKASHLDRDFPMGYRKSAPGIEENRKSEAFWKEKGILKENDEFIVSFFGTIGRQFDIKTVIQAARILKSKEIPIRFVLCGSGDKLEMYKKMARDCENVVFPGWVGEVEIWTLMKLSSVGLAPYVNSNNFNMNLPNKPVEYLSAGLPVVTCLGGTLRSLLLSYNCGGVYKDGDAEDLSSILIRLYNDKEELQHMSSNARSLYKERFMAEKVYTDMINHLRNISEDWKKRSVQH